MSSQGSERGGRTTTASAARVRASAMRHSQRWMAEDQRLRVVIAGGGVAALETALALHLLAGERVAVTMVAPQEAFAYRPMAVVEPFAYAPARHYPLAAIAAD